MVIAACIFLPLLGAFINAWLIRRNPTLSRIISLLLLSAGMAAAIVLSIQLGSWDLADLGTSLRLNTGVGAPPLSIDLEVTAGGVLAALVIYAAAMLSLSRISRDNAKAQPLLLAMVTASLGLLFSTDLFNSFVFIEIGSIITIGLTGACRCDRRWEVAVKVALVSGLLTILYLLAVAVVYKTTGELRFESLSTLRGVPALLVSTLMLTVIVTEIKAFPLSGWGLDFYEGASPVLAGTYTATWSLAVLLWSARLLPMLPLPDPRILAWLGAGGLLLGQLAGLRASSPGRILGYSTAGYASLLLVMAGTLSGEPYMLITLLMLVFAAVSKYGLFMLGNPGQRDSWSGRGTILLLLPVLTLIGIPPLPVFWAKFRFLASLAQGSPLLFGIVLAGLLAEAVYLLRFWAGRSVAVKEDRGFKPQSTASILILLVGGGFVGFRMWPMLDFSGTILGSGVIPWLFTGIFAAGSLFTLAGAFTRIRGEGQYWFWLLISAASLVLLPLAGNGMTFYLLWEMSAFSAVVAVSKGASARSGSSWYAIFAAASGFLLLGFILLSDTLGIPPLVPIILAVAAAMLKMGQAGAHLWNARAYPAAPGTVPAFLSGTSSKAAVLLLVVIGPITGFLTLGRTMALLGVLTALGMAVKAALASDYKKVLAYASVSQLGYILAGIGLASVMGWSAALYNTLHHFLFKTVLFLGAAGVILRAGTSDYNRLGGLIRRMPLTFTFTLVAVISFAGVPPLAGFGGKWLLYNALMEAGWLPAALIAMFASVVAFLYAFRLLYAVFLGQLKPEHSRLREAPLTLIVPQAILVGGIMTLSFRPTILLDRLFPAVGTIPGLSGSNPLIEGTNVISFLGNWNAWAVGSMVMGLFGFAFVLYWFSGHRPKHVGQLDIGFAGELPPSAEEIHYAGNFFKPYRRALSFLPAIHAEKVFRGAVGMLSAIGDATRAMFTGDGRTYLAHSMIFLVLCFVFLRGGV